MRKFLHATIWDGQSAYIAIEAKYFVMPILFFVSPGHAYFPFALVRPYDLHIIVQIYVQIVEGVRGRCVPVGLSPVQKAIMPGENFVGSLEVHHCFVRKIKFHLAKQSCLLEHSPNQIMPILLEDSPHQIIGNHTGVYGH